MHYDGLAIAVHVLTLSAGLPDYRASGEVVCNWGTHFPQSRLKQIKKKKGRNHLCEHTEEFITSWLQQKQQGRRALLNLPNSLYKSSQMP